jgi:glycosyltransferase involved in cell wall biosynthesis
MLLIPSDEVPLKILHLVPYYPPHRLGGVGVFVERLHGSLLSAGLQSVVVTTGVGSEPGVERIARGPLPWFLKTAHWSSRASAYDIVHFQGGEALPLLLMLALRRNRPRLLTTFHVSYTGIGESFSQYSLEGRSYARDLRSRVYATAIARLHRMLDRVAIRLSDAVNAISRQTALDVFGTAWGVPVIYYGVPEPEEEVGSEVRGPRPVDVLYAGSGGHRKRVVMLASILAHIRQHRHDARLRIVGFEPASEPDLVGLLGQKGLLDAVEFAGTKRPDELPAYYARASVLVVPSAYEGLPFVILEAMAHGLPVVATRVSGHPEAIEDGVNGFLVPLDTPAEMAERCLDILGNSQLRSRLGMAARQTVRRKFGMGRQLDEYLGLYSRLLERPPRGSGRCQSRGQTTSEEDTGGGGGLTETARRPTRTVQRGE